jgi:hypothetical protein
MSQMGQGRLWPVGGWHSRSTPSSGNTRAFRHLRFVPIAALAGERVLVRSELQFLVRVECYGVRILDQ